MMFIERRNGKFYLCEANGWILHSESTLEAMYKWCAENFLDTLSRGEIRLMREV